MRPDDRAPGFGNSWACRVLRLGLLSVMWMIPGEGRGGASRGTFAPSTDQLILPRAGLAQRLRGGLEGFRLCAPGRGAPLSSNLGGTACSRTSYSRRWRAAGAESCASLATLREIRGVRRGLGPCSPPSTRCRASSSTTGRTDPAAPSTHADSAPRTGSTNASPRRDEYRTVESLYLHGEPHGQPAASVPAGLTPDGLPSVSSLSDVIWAMPS